MLKILKRGFEVPECPCFRRTKESQKGQEGTSPVQVVEKFEGRAAQLCMNLRFPCADILLV